jgi:hypothetical protein
MSKRVSEEYAEIYHYTGDAGLRGIIESQQLWATNFAYLNDSEEHTGFFDRRLPILLERAVRKGVTEVAKNPVAKRKLDEDGGVEAVIEGLKGNMLSSLRNAAMKLNEPYITAFCGAKTPEVATDGLLSQWRGYGTQGGYAIGFHADALEKMLQTEADSYHYQFGLFADVDYGHDGGGHDHPERAELEADLENAIVTLLLSDTAQQAGKSADLARVLATLSCRYKHAGFKEEAEVRIVAMPTNEDVYRIAFEKGDRRPRKPILFRSSDGLLIPYIALFGRRVGGILEKLPISRIVVGPHIHKVKRQKSLQALLKQAQITAEVTISDIPYLGR